jgi:hypothetical protein
MNTATTNPYRPGWYEIRLQGQLDARWAARFDGMSLTVGDGQTILSGPVVDQAALHGVLQQLRDLGLPLVSVRQVEPPVDSRPRPNPDITITGA